MPQLRWSGTPQAASRTGAPGPDFSALTGPFGWRRLHPEVRRRFSSDAHGAVTYPGRLTVTRNWAGVVFALIAKALGGPLPVAAARDAGTLVCVRSNGQGGVVWERWLELRRGRTPLRIASVKQQDEQGRLLECVEGGLGMVLRVYEQDHGLVFESRSYFLTIAGRRWALPAWATPGVCRVAHHHVAQGLFRFTMTIDHGLFGRTFMQTGVFLDANA